MNPADETLPDENDDPTPEERRDADALRAYLDGNGVAPSQAEAGAVGLLLSAKPAMREPMHLPLTMAPMAALRRRGEQRTRKRHAVVFSLAAAAVLVFFLWPRASVAPAGPTPELHARAVKALASPAPIGERLSALHALAQPARERLVFDMTHGHPGFADTRAGVLVGCCSSPIASLRAAARERRQMSAIPPHVPRGRLTASLEIDLAPVRHRFGLLGPKISTRLATVVSP